jgi:hypothetical protein
MKKIWAFILAASLMLAGVSAWANSCPTLIKEGREKLASSKLTKADQGKARALLDDAQKLHDSGSHADSVKKANEALALLK